VPAEQRLPVLGGRYRLVERIARGGMGEVWRGFDEVLGRQVAVKVLRPEYADEQVFLERFRNEARSTAALIHTGIAAVYDFGQTTMARVTVPFIVMELVPGEPLSQIIERDGALDRDRALDLVAQTARALHVAHCGGVVHRDIKPANLLITPAWAVKVTDFGIARAGDTVPLTRTGTVMGTAHYLAPELVNGRGVAAPASDIYALGVVLYECLAGRRPFIGDNPLTVAMEHLNSAIPPIPGLHPAIAEALNATLAKDAKGRPATAEVLAHRLLALRIELAGEPSPDAVALRIGEAADATVVRRAASRARAGGGRHRTASPAIPKPLSPKPVGSEQRPVPAPARPEPAPTEPTSQTDATPVRGLPILEEGRGRHRAGGSDARRRSWILRPRIVILLLIAAAGIEAGVNPDTVTHVSPWGLVAAGRIAG
jgi:serine/threonine-protein kinase